MPDALRLEKATLIELQEDFTTSRSGGLEVTVQFNPETLHLTYSNNVSTRRSAGRKGHPSRMQFVGEDKASLDVDLVFDVTAPLPNGGGFINDVSDLTAQVKYFITPQSESGNVKPPFVPPALSFSWGSFHFNGVMKSLSETLEFFSNDGHPLRASIHFTMERQRANLSQGTNTPFGSSAAGTVPFESALAGTTIQQIADSLGQGSNWQAIAAANSIENPRILKPGQLVNVNIGVKL